MSRASGVVAVEVGNNTARFGLEMNRLGGRFTDGSLTGQAFYGWLIDWAEHLHQWEL